MVENLPFVRAKPLIVKNPIYTQISYLINIIILMGLVIRNTSMEALSTATFWILTVIVSLIPLLVWQKLNSFFVVKTKEVGKTSKSSRSSRRSLQADQLKAKFYAQDDTRSQIQTI
jgi:hypothetical protein